MVSYRIDQIAERTDGRLDGPGDLVINGVNDLEGAKPGTISFIRDHRHAPNWSTSKASAAVVLADLELEPGAGRAFIRVDDADVALVAVLEMFADPAADPAAGVDATALVDASATIGQDVAIGPGCVVGKDVGIGDGCVVYARVVLLDGVVLGSGCRLYPGVVVRERCELGHRVIVHPNAVIGADGFNYCPGPSGLVKIPHIGGVLIGDDVEIGAGTCIDRGKFTATTIGAGTKIDNLCQVGHNCRIGRHCLIAGQAGLAGSVTLGDGVVLAGQVGVADHRTIGAGAQVGGGAVVINDIPTGAKWFGHPAGHARSVLREIAIIRKLPGLAKVIRQLEKSQGR